LIVGCGDVGVRVARRLARPQRVIALTSTPARADALRAQGITPIVGNLDQPASLRRLSGLADRVLHLAPPPSDQEGLWWRDPRTVHLLRALKLRRLPTRLVYGSTSGVYGDCQGQWVSESRPVQPHTPRAQRRVDAESALRHFGRSGVTISIPGIYAHDREGGTPRARLERGTPVLRAEDDVYTNHIHADDLARACIAALHRGRAQRAYNISDDSTLKMGDYFDLAADLYQLPRPKRIARQTAQGELPLMLLSFMSESRRLDNTRMKTELRLQLHYPHVMDGLRA
jgi:nucleoside-diphosphate-sugar epimerase